MARKSLRGGAYEKQRFPPTGNLNTRRYVKNKEKSHLFKYISVFRGKYRIGMNVYSFVSR